MLHKTCPGTGVPPRCGIILAAGEGKRLQPFIRKLRADSLPKQYVNIMGKRSMLEHTFCRAQELIRAERIFTVVNKSHLRYPEVTRQLSTQPNGRVIVQPANKETGPGVLLPLVHLYKRYPESTVVVFPSDHFVLEEDLFMSYVELAFRVIEEDPSRLVLLGIRPSQPEPEYGYILPGRELKSLGRAVAREVSKFIEKPEPSLGREIILNGGLWNTMVMVFKAQMLLRWVAKLDPMLHNSFAKVLDAVGTPSEVDVIRDVYTHLNPVNFSHGLLQSLSSQRPCPVLVLPVQGVYWSDWGSEERIVSVLGRIRYLERLNGNLNTAFPACGTSRRPHLTSERVTILSSESNEPVENNRKTIWSRRDVFTRVG